MKRLLLSALIALLPVAAAAQGLSGKLVLYTSQPNTDAQQTIDAFKAKHPGVDISFVRDGTPRILAKLRAEFEAGQPQAEGDGRQDHQQQVAARRVREPLEAGRRQHLELDGHQVDLADLKQNHSITPGSNSSTG